MVRDLKYTIIIIVCVQFQLILSFPLYDIFTSMCNLFYIPVEVILKQADSLEYNFHMFCSLTSHILDPRLDATYSRINQYQWLIALTIFTLKRDALPSINNSVLILFLIGTVIIVVSVCSLRTTATVLNKGLAWLRPNF